MKMAKLVCRLCLSENVRMNSIENTPLQETYEKLTNISLATVSGADMACYICYSLLQKSHRLQQQCIIANNVLLQLWQDCHLEVPKQMPHRESRESFQWRLERSQVTLTDSTTQVTITDSTTLSPRNCDILKHIKKEETIEYEESLPDATEAEYTTEMIIEISGQQSFKQQGPIKFEVSNKIVHLNTTEKLSENDRTLIKYDDNDGTPPANRLHQHQQGEDIETILTYEENIFEPKYTIPIFFENENQKSIETDNCVNNEAIVTDKIKDSKLMHEIISAKTSVCEPFSNEPDNAKISLKNIYYYCNNCEYQSVTKNSLEKHMRSHDESRQFSYNLEDYFHSNNKQFLCNTCTYKSTKKSRLKTHVMRHFGEKPFACNICTYKCATNSNLKSHLLRHSGDKPFACNICTFKCKQKTTLKTHMLTHSDDKPFACNICSYKCKSTGPFKRHLLIHSGDKPFACKICTFKCTQKTTLKTHMLTHSGEKPFACNICIYKCTTKSGLKRHLMIHSDDKPFACNICSYKAKIKSYLDMHLLTHGCVKLFANRKLT